MTTNHKPATALPWKTHHDDMQIGSLSLNGDGDYSGEGYSKQDAAYIAHAANAYPRWVEFAKFIASQDPNGMTAQGNRARALMRELGEGS